MENDLGGMWRQSHVCRESRRKQVPSFYVGDFISRYTATAPQQLSPNSYTYDSDISATHTHILCSCINSPLVYRVLIGVRTPFGVEVFDVRICERPLHTTSVKLLVVV